MKISPGKFLLEFLKVSVSRKLDLHPLAQACDQGAGGFLLRDCLKVVAHFFCLHLKISFFLKFLKYILDRSFMEIDKFISCILKKILLLSG